MLYDRKAWKDTGHVRDLSGSSTDGHKANKHSAYTPLQGIALFNLSMQCTDTGNSQIHW